MIGGGEGAAYGSLGNCYQSLGDYRKSIQYLEKQLKIAMEKGKPMEISVILARHWVIMKKLLSIIKQLLKFAVEISDRGEGRAYGNLGDA